jgi:hypothetical protein
MGLRDPLASTDQVRPLTSAAARLADVRATVCLVGLPEQIAQRELAVLKHELSLDDDQLTVERHPDAFGPGNTVHVHVPGDGYTEVFTGFVVLPQRWIVERTFAWLMQNRRLVPDHETPEASAEAFVYLAMIRLMLNRLA